MPRLLIPIVSAVRGGAEEYAAAIAAYAAENGYDVHVLLSNRPSMSDFAAQLGPGITTHRLPIEEAGVKTGFLPRTLRMNRMRGTIRSIKPDVALLPLPGIRYGLGILRLCTELDIPCFSVYQLARWEQWTGRLRDQLAPLLNHQMLKTIVVSDFDRAALLERTNLPNDRVAVIHNGINLERFTHPDSDRDRIRRSVRESLHLPADSTLCLSVGRLDTQKGCDLLVAAIPKLIKIYPNLHFLWAGEGPLQPKLLHDAKIMGITGWLHLLGRRTDVPELLAAADVFAFPSRFEGFPFALLEAMAAHVPVVAADIPAVREASGPDAALLVPPDDVYHLRRGLADLLAHPDASRARVDNAFERVQQFSVAEMCQKMLDELQSHKDVPANA